MMKKLIKRIDVGHMLLVLFIAGSVGWYFFDAYTASSNIQNIILIAPASIVAMVLCLILLYQIFYSALSKKTESTQSRPSQHKAPAGKDAFWKQMQGILKRISRYRILAFIITFGLYVGFLEIIGFDIATYLFIGVIMALQGERHIWIIVAYSLVFGTLAVWLFGLMIPYPMFTRLVPN